MKRIHLCSVDLMVVLLAGYFNASSGIAGEAGKVAQPSHYAVDSKIAMAHTMELREAQQGIAHIDAGENIAFVLDNGINVQFADGTGRRLLITRPTGYRTFLYPSWSLDGTMIAFGGQRTDPRVADLIVANADGTNATVILTLDSGYYTGFVQSISWSWDHQYIMFNYLYDDSQLNTSTVLCTVRRDGQNFVFVQDPIRSYSAYEPVNQSQRYAYVSMGSPFDANTRLRVSNLNGTNDIVWFTVSGAIAGLTHVSWKSSTSIYTVIRNWSQYPNKEVLLRIDKTTGGSTWTVIAESDVGASLWAPSSSPGRNQFYIAELTSSTATLYLTTLGSNGLPTSIDPKGTGLYPNWRQQIPNAVEDPGSSIVGTFALAQNYPNPFNPVTTIGYQCTRAGHVTLKVYDVLGREVSTLVDEVKQPGTYAVHWDASNVAAGAYFYRLQAGDFVAGKKLLLLK